MLSHSNNEKFQIENVDSENHKSKSHHQTNDGISVTDKDDRSVSSPSIDNQMRV
jgi:hypothetical protein